MAELKTKRTEASVQAFLNGVANETQREDAFRLVEIMREVSGEPPRMWGPAIVGFGEHHYVYASGHEGDTLRTGFSPRKDALALYGLLGSKESNALLKKLGKVKAGKGCLYVKRLEDVDVTVLRDMIRAALARFENKSSSRPKPAAKKSARRKS